MEHTGKLPKFSGAVVVCPEWLLECCRRGQVLPVRPYTMSLHMRLVKTCGGNVKKWASGLLVQA